MAVPLESFGNTVLSLQIAILFFLVIGLPFVKGRENKKNAKRNGYLTALCLVLRAFLIFVVMIPFSDRNFGVVSNLSILGSIDLWSHVILGTTVEASP
jgi:hypothetical protein